MKMKTLREQLERKCVHFNGIQNDTCRAGCHYDKMDEGRRVPYRAALPCFKVNQEEQQVLDARGVEQASCEHRRFPTDEEIVAAENEMNDAIEKVLLAQRVIEPIRKEHAGENWSDVLECPNCKGRLHVRHAACNGHVRAKCETEGCVSWVE